MSIQAIAEETQEGLNDYIPTRASIGVDWIDDAYLEEISAAKDEGEFMSDTKSVIEYEPEEGVVESFVLRSFDCRRPAYSGQWLYYYSGCQGVFSRIRRNRVHSIVATGYCGFPTRRFKVYYYN